MNSFLKKQYSPKIRAGFSELFPMNKESLRQCLTGGDRRSIAQSDRAREIVEKSPWLVSELAALADDPDWLISQRALDLLEKIAHDHPEWVEPHKQIFIGPLAESDKWEVRLQIVRALSLFEWAEEDRERVKRILLENVAFPQTFVRAWALDSLATVAVGDRSLMRTVRHSLLEFEQSKSKALQARSRKIRERLKIRSR
jgi:hypothetical protein